MLGPQRRINLVFRATLRRENAVGGVGHGEDYSLLKDEVGRMKPEYRSQNSEAAHTILHFAFFIRHFPFVIFYSVFFLLLPSSPTTMSPLRLFTCYLPP